MIIKTITCHDVNNYGASLQAYALLSFLRKFGHDVEIIDYLPDYKADRLNFISYNRKNGRIHSIISHLSFLKPVVGLLDHIINKRSRMDMKFFKRKKPFNEFKRFYLNCTDKHYNNIDELKIDVPKADLYIAGSDQIWNSVALNGRDEAYYCSFVPSGTKVISYAASFGVSYIPDEHKSFVYEQLKRFDCISVRESSGVEIVNSLGLSAKEVLDPVFLLNKSEWESLCKEPTTNEKYLLVYDLDMNHPGVQKLCEDLSKKNGWKIYSLNDFNICPYADFNINDAGPLQFLKWIKDAQFVICTSFHGSAFSIIFEKQFYTFPLYGQSNSTRMSDFLKKIGLNDHYVKDIIELKNLTTIDYAKINTTMVSYIQDSKDWLLSNIIQKK